MSKQIPVLITSNCIIDTEIGLLKLVQFNYRNTDIWLDYILDNLELELQQYLMYTRVNPNPLSVILKQEKWDDLDELYNQFMTEELDSIIELSCNSSVINIVGTAGYEDTPLRITILCNNQKEIDIIRMRLGESFHDIDFIIKTPDKLIDTGKYSSIYVKYIEDLQQFNVLKNRNIYISDHRLNMINEERKALCPDALKYMKDNVLNIYSLYQFEEEIVG